MPENMNLSDILRDNPAIDPDELRASMELQENLKKRGVLQKGYDLVPPFSGKQVHVIETLTADTDVTCR